MATIRPSESISQATPTPTLPSKALPTNAAVSQKAAKPVASSAPRIDLEPLYTALKSAIGDNWGIYKEATSLFILGQLNQEELSRRIDHFIRTDASRERLHNQFICAIYSNAFRDAPEPGVASWVSANDKPTAVPKPVSGDAAEQRLKTEVMQLPARDRHRLKGIPDDPFDQFTQTMQEFHMARQIKLPDLGPTSAGGLNKTNWDLEIRKRYAQPLFSETLEFPSAESISARMLPISYEEGLPSGAAAGCAEFVAIAAETYIKEALANFFGRVRSNGERYIKTAAYKRQLEREENSWLKGEVVRNAGGFLPVEIEANARRAPLNVNDLRLALELGDSFLGQVPLISGKIVSDGYVDADVDDWDDTPADNAGRPRAMKGMSRRVVNGGGHSDEMDIDENDWGWQGGAVNDRDALCSVLDDCLAP
ncbi:hypothetical protein W97_07421 [Coniosporium apollinis CBS 100218]|uniref:Transcriptional coactivator HFI1/ADA1 n=1 Tax=Coniosporium apollinis (strain CBS 100218) TaxID=1168221 RepID=R7Z1K6_CONA1|nr:uncharacterized protein W97_07421 [Coniosporium apollinis CBS 100218]EON67924.1 hypothetical protein W97_07421 [Coniosporium apollinis CBS 100218]